VFPDWPGKATSVVPSAEDATACQGKLVGALVRTQVAPESDEV
jgi:hypothetical protein